MTGKKYLNFEFENFFIMAQTREIALFIAQFNKKIQSPFYPVILQKQIKKELINN